MCWGAFEMQATSRSKGLQTRRNSAGRAVAVDATFWAYDVTSPGEWVGAWGKQSVITHPFDTTKKRSPRCVADFMAQPRGETLEDDVTDFDAFAARELHVHGRHWYVEWRPEFDTAQK